MAYKKKTRIKSEPSKSAHDFTHIENADPNYKYCFVHKDGQNAEEDAATWMNFGYEPARGDEKLKGQPFASPDHDDKNGLKVRGNRILVKCPKEVWLARKKEQLANLRRKVSPKKSIEADMKRIVAESGISPDLVQIAAQ